MIQTIGTCICSLETPSRRLNRFSQKLFWSFLNRKVSKTRVRAALLVCKTLNLQIKTPHSPTQRRERLCISTHLSLSRWCQRMMTIEKKNWREMWTERRRKQSLHPSLTSACLLLGANTSSPGRSDRPGPDISCVHCRSAQWTAGPGYTGAAAPGPGGVKLSRPGACWRRRAAGGTG